MTTDPLEKVTPSVIAVAAREAFPEEPIAVYQVHEEAQSSHEVQSILLAVLPGLLAACRLRVFGGSRQVPLFSAELSTVGIDAVRLVETSIERPQDVGFVRVKLRIELDRALPPFEGTSIELPADLNEDYDGVRQTAWQAAAEVRDALEVERVLTVMAGGQSHG